MNSLKTLRTFIGTLFYLSVLFYIIIVGLLIYMKFFSQDLAAMENLHWLSINASATHSLIFYSWIITGMLYIFTLKLFKDLVSHFYRKDFFSLNQINRLKIIGILILSIKAVQLLASFISVLITQGKIEFGLHIKYDFTGTLFHLVLGLFFLFLSKIFKVAQQHKNEINLTI
ncbi:DUF2975 domain-containing protein [Mesonia sp. HuA40]|uniref:DUF2975 domain-containing protein n=1 Tax=Mesonia sp. HuA40 TaxID=2602761 RepID=UPI0011CCD0EE|nr:DUF2975 domain-containing protein [Mesonia sp. HuA40]TXK71541.1 DUF2975 domain-containing protein [Mesonia sp. HuA40]